MLVLGLPEPEQLQQLLATPLGGPLRYIAEDMLKKNGTIKHTLTRLLSLLVCQWTPLTLSVLALAGVGDMTHHYRLREL